MSENEQPKEAEKTIYERDKTAKDPKPAADGPIAPIKPINYQYPTLVLNYSIK